MIGGFAEQLWPLTEELESLYGDWLPRLRAAFGPWKRPNDADPLGDPDGVDGISRRGLWERLLMSEWAVADAVPDEFIRRAAMKEQLFLQLARVAPSASAVTRVWLDCGPDQLGAPRLAHLAILVVLRRRAAEVGGTVLWAPLHAPDDLHDTLDPLEVLACRTTERACPELTGDGERFVVGAQCPGARCIQVLEGDGLTVVIDGRAVQLALPDVTEVAMILGRPMVPVHGSPRHEPTGALCFNPEGGALIVELGARVYAFAVPELVRERTKVRSSDWGEEPLAGVGWHRQRLVTLRRDGDQAKLLMGGDTFRMPWPVGMVPGGMSWMQVLPRATMTVPPVPRRAVVARDATGTLFLLDFDRSLSLPLARSCTPAFFGNGALYWIEASHIQRWLPGHDGSSDIPALADFRSNPIPHRAGQVYTVHGGRMYGATSAKGHRWSLHEVPAWGSGPIEGNGVVCEHPAVGVVRVGGPLAMVSRDGDRLYLTGHQNEEFARIEGLEAVAVGGRKRPLVAARNYAGEIQIIDLVGRKPWLKFDPREMGP